MIKDLDEDEIKQRNDSLVAELLEKYSVRNLVTNKSVLEFLIRRANTITETYRRYSDNYIASLIFEQWVLFSEVLLGYCNKYKQVNPFSSFSKENIEFFQQESYALLFFLRASFKTIDQVPIWRYKRFYTKDNRRYRFAQPKKKNIVVIEDKEKQKALIQTWQHCFDRFKSDTADQMELLCSQFTPEFPFYGIPRVLNETPSYFWDKSFEIIRVFSSLLLDVEDNLFFVFEYLDSKNECNQTRSLEYVSLEIRYDTCVLDPSTNPLFSTETLNEASSKALSIISKGDLVSYYNEKNPDQPSYQEAFAAFKTSLLEKEKEK